MSARRGERRALLAVVPVVVLALVTGGWALGSARSPTRITLELSWQAPSWARPLGSAEAGVDLLALLTHGTARALALAATVAAFGFVLGTPLGAAAGLRRGRVLAVTLRLCDLVQAFPSFLLALAVLSAVTAPSRAHLAGVFCLTSWAPFTRLAAAQARTLASAQFVEAARALGLRPWQVLARHVVPNLLGPVAIQAGGVAAGVVLGETALGFVGLGPSDGVSLGAVLEQGVAGMLRAPHVLAFGALAVAAASGSLQLASEGLRRWMLRAPAG